ncbi:unnamed protein product [Linum tenue]|uniref:Uncharacterized protein n=1 Tax=Linum tenue TaxID=586396 RepID=A0AAV0KH56_9ROSI|nr:unnamed protein product [Linum tenue]CAI0421690.1 unnamed protein product [Linum tenue]
MRPILALKFKLHWRRRNGTKFYSASTLAKCPLHTSTPTRITSSRHARSRE